MVKKVSLKKIPAVVIILFAVMGTVLTYTTAGLVSFQNANSTVNRRLASSGNIAAVNVGIYSDFACSQKLESIDWGDIAPGELVTKIIYLKNTGNTPIILSMTTNNWNPPNANGPITLSWNQEGRELKPSELISATLTLSVREDITGIATFSVSILIVGSS
jgi:hypothetical protein